MSALINVTGADEHNLGADEPGLSRTVLCQANLFHHPVKGLERPNSGFLRKQKDFMNTSACVGARKSEGMGRTAISAC